MQKGFSAVLLLIIIFVFLIAGVFIWFRASKTLPISNIVISPKSIFEWKSPSSNKSLKVFTNGGLTFLEGDKQVEIYPDMKRLSLDLDSSNVVWSPDERYATLFRSPLGGIYCSDAKFCEYRPYFGAKVFEEVKDIYWLDNDNAIVVYLHRPNLQISKLTFPHVGSLRGSDQNDYYPSEKQLGQTPYSDRFGVVPHPKTISPDGKYIIFESGYEFTSSPQALNTATSKLTTLAKGKDSYIISSKPNYKWQGSVLEFEGGLPINGQVGDYLNKTKPFEIIKVDLPAQGY